MDVYVSPDFLSVRPHVSGALTGRNFVVSYLEFLPKFVDAFHFRLKPDKNS